MPEYKKKKKITAIISPVARKPVNKPKARVQVGKRGLLPAKL